MTPDEATRIARIETLYAAAAERILVLDGSWRAKIQDLRLTEEEFRGERFAHHPVAVRGNADLLCLTRPEVVTDLLQAYLGAGADIASTNTFAATAVAQSEYGLQEVSPEINLAAARLARAAADRFTELDPSQPRWVAGSIGPTNTTLSLSALGEGRRGRDPNFDDLYETYRQQAIALYDGGVDLFLVETVFDTLNAKAALKAILDLQDERGIPLPIWISGAVADSSDREPSERTVDDFWAAVRHAEPFAVGLNCSLGAESMRPFLAGLAAAADTLVSACPSAGRADELGAHGEGPEFVSRHLHEWGRDGLVNVVGGCCGTAPAHIRAIAEAVEGISPRPVPETTSSLPPSERESVGGLVSPASPGDPWFIRVGERIDVAGSCLFQWSVLDETPTELEIACSQIEHGVDVLYVSVDDGVLDSERAITAFLQQAAAEPDLARIPVMIDSSTWSVTEAALKCVPGKAIVKSLNLKDGEGPFLAAARKLRRYGAAVIVKAADEQGEAVTTERKVAICERAHDLLTQHARFDPGDIIFDPGIFAAGGDTASQDDRAVAFIEAVWQIKERLPGTRVSGTVSNLTSAFPGTEPARKAMQSVFLHHAIAAGLDMAILDAGTPAVYETIEPELRERVEDLILNRRPELRARRHESHGPQGNVVPQPLESGVSVS